MTTNDNWRDKVRRLQEVEAQIATLQQEVKRLEAELNTCPNCHVRFDYMFPGEPLCGKCGYRRD